MLFAVPELSDDFYRFIWDGLLLSKGISPFSELPSTMIKDPAFAELAINQLLFDGMNSKDYFTIYPPLSQWIFLVAARLSPDNILGNLVVIRLFIILSEIGSLLLIMKLLKDYGLPANSILIYAWNPLVIVELTGNLHFEAIMIFFLLLAIYFYRLNRIGWSSMALAASIAVKLIPLIFLPLLVLRRSWKKVVGYWILCMVSVGILFFSVWSPELTNSMQSSLSLYFQKFEFNASIYYLVREIGYAIKGYNIIQSAGMYLALVTLFIILIFSFYSYKNMPWPKAMLWALTIYLFMSTTVHPWYITPMVALVVFSNYKFPIAWSMLVIISYAGYTQSGYSENLYLVTTEYLLVFMVLLWDLISERYPVKKALNLVETS